MGEIVSLKLHRKRSARTETEAHAAENRVKFGRTKAEKALADSEAAKAAKDLDAHKREE